MNFKDAVRTCVKEKYATFQGRASRSEFWWFNLFVWIVAFPLGIIGFAFIDFNTGEPSTLSIVFFILAGVFWLAMFIPLISATVRRFHDRNLSGWWYLLIIAASMIPVVGWMASVAQIVICVMKGNDGDNRFGPDPLKEGYRADVFS